MMNYLSEHFTLEEMTASETARKMHIDNTPPDFAIKELENLVYTGFGASPAAKIWSSANDNKRLPLLEIESHCGWSA